MEEEKLPLWNLVIIGRGTGTGRIKRTSPNSEPLLGRKRGHGSRLPARNLAGKKGRNPF